MLDVEATEAELAIIPRGTGGDFVRTFGIPARLEDAVRVALRRWHARRRRSAASPTARGPVAPGQSYFANIASVGMSGASPSGRTSRRELRWRRLRTSRHAHRLRTLAELEVARPVDDEIRGGADVRRDRRQCRYLAGGMKICPDAEPDDGLFDVAADRRRDRSSTSSATLPKIYRGTHLPHPKAELLRGKGVSIDSDEPLPIQLDGEQPGTTPVRFELVSKALRLRVPA